MSVHDILKNNPALVDELLRDLNSYALQTQGFHSLPLGKTRDMDTLRSLVLAWVARLEAQEPAGDMNAPTHEPRAGTSNTSQEN